MKAARIAHKKPDGTENTEMFEVMIFCPGCRCGHSIHAKPAKSPYNGATWDFNGDYDRPTFSPSVLVTRDWGHKPLVCHSFVRDGKIQFLSDSQHALAGQTVELPDLDNLNA
jgi:hypothetical protein